jgi:hypothetical protein
MDLYWKPPTSTAEASPLDPADCLELLTTDGQHVVVLSSVAKAPGTPFLVFGPNQERFEIKVRACRLAGDERGRFRIEGRFMNLSATGRQALLGALGR